MLLDVDSVKKELLKDFEGLINPDKVITRVWNSDVKVIDLGYIFKTCRFSIDYLIKYQEFLNQNSCYWGSFISCQVITDPEIYNIFGKIFSYFNLWDTVVSCQLLSEDIILKYLDNINFKSGLIEYQRLSSSLLERLIDSCKDCDELILFELFNSIVCNQFLEEDFIMYHLPNLSIEDISFYQRLTPKILSKVKGVKNVDSFIRYNYFYKTDLGRNDWFIGYIKEIVTDNGLKIYSPVLPSYTDFDKFNNHDPNSIKKARVFYKDVITLNKFKKVDIIREYSGEKEVNFYKR